MERISVWGYRCRRCGHMWIPRRGLELDPNKPAPRVENPRMCPHCKSVRWDVEEPDTGARNKHK